MTDKQPHLAAPDANPSFTKGVFLGEIREDLVFPFPELAAEERESLRMILDSIRAYAAERVDSAKFDHDGAFPDGVRQGLHELGVMGLSIPEEYGGFGASAKVYNRVFGEIGGTDPALCVYFGAHQSIGCKGIVLFGTEEQKQRFLPRCASGELVAAFCLTEPGSGSDAQAMKTTAVLSDDGTHYLLERHEDLDLECRLRRSVHRVREGRRRRRRRAQGTRDRVHRRRARAPACRSASAKRRWASRPPTRAPCSSTK